MATTLPASTDYTGASVTQGEKKTFMTSFRSFVADLFGTDSTMATAHGAFKNMGAATMNNAGMAASVAASALTISLKTAAGSDPSASDPVLHSFRSATAGTGTVSMLAATAAQSLVIPSGATMGASNGTPFRLWIVQFNDGGVLRLGAINCAGSGGPYALRDNVLASSTAVSAAADSAQVIYTGSAVASKAMRVLGWMEWSSGLTTAGTWDAAPTTIQMFSPGQDLPGMVVSSVYGEYTTNADLSTVIPADDTIPQNTEGSQIISVSITPRSTTSRVRVRFKGMWSSSSATISALAAIFSSLSSSALRASIQTNINTNFLNQLGCEVEFTPATTSAVTISVRVGPNTAGNIRFNGNGTSRIFGGAAGATVIVEEICC